MMKSENKNPYVRFESAKLILRDELAIDRTLLANERTLMAYLRSGVALGIAGASILHFSDVLWFWMIGLLCLPAALGCVILGVLRYRKVDARIAMIRVRAAGSAEQGREIR
jgi:putative membrane protein